MVSVRGRQAATVSEGLPKRLNATGSFEVQPMGTSGERLQPPAADVGRNPLIGIERFRVIPVGIGRYRYRSIPVATCRVQQRDSGITEGRKKQRRGTNRHVPERGSSDTAANRRNRALEPRKRGPAYLDLTSVDCVRHRPFYAVGFHDLASGIHVDFRLEKRVPR